MDYRFDFNADAFVSVSDPSDLKEELITSLSHFLRLYSRRRNRLQTAPDELCEAPEETTPSIWCSVFGGLVGAACGGVTGAVAGVLGAVFTATYARFFGIIDAVGATVGFFGSVLGGVVGGAVCGGVGGALRAAARESGGKVGGGKVGDAACLAIGGSTGSAVGRVFGGDFCAEVGEAFGEAAGCAVGRALRAAVRLSGVKVGGGRVGGKIGGVVGDAACLAVGAVTGSAVGGIFGGELGASGGALGGALGVLCATWCTVRSVGFIVDYFSSSETEEEDDVYLQTRRKIKDLWETMEPLVDELRTIKTVSGKMADGAADVSRVAEQTAKTLSCLAVMSEHDGKLSSRSDLSRHLEETARHIWKITEEMETTRQEVETLLVSLKQEKPVELL